MLQTLFYIPLEIAGVPVFGFGWLLAVWAVVSVVLLADVAWRHGVGSEFWSYLPLVGLVAAAIVWLLPAVCEPEGLPIRGYGMMLLLAVVAGTGLLVWRGRRAGLDPDLMFSLVFWMFVPGILGARLFYVIEYWPDYQKATPGETLAAVVNFTKGGLVVYGSLIGGLLGFLAFVRKHRLPVLAVADLMAPCLLLGLALGRVGCLMNGCCFGGPCDLPWAVTFPMGSPVYDREVSSGKRPSLGELLGMTLGIDGAAAPVLEDVEPDGPLGRAGLRRGDRLARIAGHVPRKTADADLLLQHAFRAPEAVLDRDGRRPDGRGDRLARAAAKPAGPPDAAVQRDQRSVALPVPVGLRPVPPPRRRAVRADADDLPDHAVPAGDHPHRRERDLRHGPEHLAERQPRGHARHRRPVVLHPPPPPRNRLRPGGRDVGAAEPTPQTESERWRRLCRTITSTSRSRGTPGGISCGCRRAKRWARRCTGSSTA